MESMQGLAEDVSDPASEKAAILFLSRAVSTWGQHVVSPPSPENGQAQGGLPGFDRFIYEHLVPIAFRVPSSPQFNMKDGQMMVVSYS